MQERHLLWPLTIQLRSQAIALMGLVDPNLI